MARVIHAVFPEKTLQNQMDIEGAFFRLATFADWLNAELEWRHGECMQPAAVSGEWESLTEAEYAKQTALQIMREHGFSGSFCG